MRLITTLLLAVACATMPRGSSALQHPGGPLGIASSDDVGYLLRSMLEEGNRAIVEKAVTDVFINGGTDPDTALESLEKYFHPELRQHSPYAVNGRDYYRGFIGEERPEGMKYEMGGVFVEGEWVFIYFRLESPTVYETPQLGFDIFRVDPEGRLSAHWDNMWVEVPQNETGSGLPMWPVAEPPAFSGANEERNKRRVNFAADRLTTHADASVVDPYFADGVIFYGPTAFGGKDYLKAFANGRVPGELTYEIGFVMAYGDYVLIYNRLGGPVGAGALGAGQVGVDIYHVDPETALIDAFWKTRQDEVPVLDTASGNAVFPMYT